jgi:hypothetical protein
MRRIFPLVALALLAIPLPVNAAVKHEAHVQKTAASGEPLTLGDVFYVGPGCVVGGQVYIRELTGPTHGTFTNQPAMVYPNLPASDPLHVCNGKRVHGYNQVYVSARGYTGPDAVSFTIIWSNGDYQKVHIAIDVK